MKGKVIHFKLFFIILIFIFLSGCDGATPISPVITFFTATPSSITLGDSATLSWSVIDADTITIDQGIGTVTNPSGSILVSPIATTPYTLTATNSAGDVTYTVTITVVGCIDFESLTLGKEFNVGDMFVDSGVVINVLPFQWESSSWTTGGYAKVYDGSYAGVSGKEININNVNLGFQFSSSLKGLSLNFGEYGGNINIQVNDEFKNFQNFDDINGTTIGGVNISIINGSGDEKGRLILSGDMGTFNFQEKDFTFLIGGQELWIDHVCPSW